MNYVEIDGRVWDVLVTEITETFDILHGENTGRTIATGARMTLNPLGTFYGYQITFMRKKGFEDEYDELFYFLAKPRSDGLMVNIVHGQAPWSEPFEAYVSQGSRKLKKIDPRSGKVFWEQFTVKITPMEAQELPTDE